LPFKIIISGFTLNKEEKRIYSFIKRNFFYRPKNMSLFMEALCHKSKAKKININSNERLEYLGDAILDAIVADFLFLEFPNSDEGQLTRIKAKIVNRASLSMIGGEMEIRKVLIYDSSRPINLSSLEGNALEAIIGAIFLDGGFVRTKKIILKIIKSHYGDFTAVLKQEIDFKSKLHIWCQKNRLHLEYRLQSEEKKGEKWEYFMEVFIDNKPYGKGQGSTKKSAEQEASKETLELIGEF